MVNLKFVKQFFFLKSQEISHEYLVGENKNFRITKYVFSWKLT